MNIYEITISSHIQIALYTYAVVVDANRIVEWKEIKNERNSIELCKSELVAMLSAIIRKILTQTSLLYISTQRTQTQWYVKWDSHQNCFDDAICYRLLVSRNLHVHGGSSTKFDFRYQYRGLIEKINNSTFMDIFVYHHDEKQVYFAIGLMVIKFDICLINMPSHRIDNSTHAVACLQVYKYFEGRGNVTNSCQNKNSQRIFCIYKKNSKNAHR